MLMSSSALHRCRSSRLLFTCSNCLNMTAWFCMRSSYCSLRACSTSSCTSSRSGRWHRVWYLSHVIFSAGFFNPWDSSRRCLVRVRSAISWLTRLSLPIISRFMRLMLWQRFSSAFCTVSYWIFSASLALCAIFAAFSRRSFASCSCCSASSMPCMVCTFHVVGTWKSFCGGRLSSGFSHSGQVYPRSTHLVSRSMAADLSARSLVSIHFTLFRWSSMSSTSSRHRSILLRMSWRRVVSLSSCLNAPSCTSSACGRCARCCRRSILISRLWFTRSRSICSRSLHSCSFDISNSVLSSVFSKIALKFLS
mmetsp:Transcript_38673/g.84116  ORF Transcript_38673/g.84116 Transcript_38673/m.84116 type:complete len:308 (-) Transcript_38673:768-1691(-)